MSQNGKDRSGKGSNQRRQFLKGIAGLGTVGLTGLAGCVGGGGGGGSYPSQQIRDIVPWGEGGGTDTWQRQVIPVLEDEVDVQIVIENITGAGGTRGTGVFLNEGDDHTLLANNLAIMPSAILDTRPPWASDLTEIVPVYGYGVNANMIIGANGKAQNFGEFLEMIQTDEVTNIATPGPGSLGELVFKTMSLFDEYPVSEDDWEMVPYDSGAAVGRAVINGETDAGCTAATALVRQYDGSNFVPLVSASSQGVGGMPDLPTVVDEGYPNIDVVGQNTRCQWLAPGTSEEKAQTMADHMSTVIDSDEIQSWSEETGNTTAHIGPDELGDLLTESMRTLPTLLGVDTIDGWPEPS